MSDIKITIRNYDNYKGRSDVKNNSWFRLSNRFLEDSEFFDFSAEEKLVWIYFLSLASQKNNGTIHVSVQHAHHVCKLPKSVLTSAIKKLNNINCIEIPRTRTSRGRYVRDTHTCATDRTDRTEQTEQNTTEHTEPNKSVAVALKKPEIIFKFSENKNISVSQDLVNSWLDTFPKEFLDEEIKKARSWVLSNEHKAPKSQWGRFLNQWFNRGWEGYRKGLKSHPTKLTMDDLNDIFGEAT